MSGPISAKLQRLVSTFSDHQSGSVAVITGVLIVPLLAMAGFAVDYSRHTKVQADLQSMADSASLEAALSLNKDPRSNYDMKAHRFKVSNQDEELSKVNWSVSKDEPTKTVKVELATKVKNYFGAFLG